MADGEPAGARQFGERPVLGDAQIAHGFSDEIVIGGRVGFSDFGGPCCPCGHGVSLPATMSARVKKAKPIFTRGVAASAKRETTAQMAAKLSGRAHATWSGL